MARGRCPDPAADEARRRKISEALKGRTKGPEYRRKLSEAMRGRTLSPEHRAKLKGPSEATKRAQRRTLRLRHYEGRYRCPTCQLLVPKDWVIEDLGQEDDKE